MFCLMMYQLDIPTSKNTNLPKIAGGSGLYIPNDDRCYEPFAKMTFKFPTDLLAMLSPLYWMLPHRDQRYIVIPIVKKYIEK